MPARRAWRSSASRVAATACSRRPNSWTPRRCGRGSSSSRKRGACRAPGPVEVVDQIESTSSELMRRAQRRDVHRVALAAEWQSAGRGRRGRAWTAIAGGSLTFSLGWKFEQGAGFLAGLSLAVGVAVVRALEAEGFKDVALKWPNDLIHRHLKVGGILIELNGDALGPTTTVIGVGLNVRIPPAARKDIAVPVTDLASIAGRRAPPDRPQPAARGAPRRARRGARSSTRAKASRRSPPSGSTATRIRASRCGFCCRTGRRSPARSPASMRAARWCWPTARAACASCPARSRSAAHEGRRVTRQSGS